MTERLSAGLDTELRELRSELPRVGAIQLIKHARAAALLISWCRRALAEGHLVSTAAALRTSLGLGRLELQALRIPVDVLELFPRWREGVRDGFRPPSSHASLLPSAAGLPLGGIRLLLAPATGALPLVLPLLRGLVSRLDAESLITVMVDPGNAARDFARIAREAFPDRRRVRFETGRSATMFARDHALAARGPKGEGLLLVPRGFRPVRGKEDTPLDVRSTRRALGIQVRSSLLYWEGGNILYDGHRCLIGADLVRENIGRLGLARDEIVAVLEAEFGTPVAVLGEVSRSAFDGRQDRISRTGQASYHIDLDVTPLGAVDGGPPVAMLTDPDLGLGVLPRVLRHSRLDHWHGLAPRVARKLQREEYERVAGERRPRLEQYRRQLERQGYRVVATPELRVETDRSLAGVGNMDFSYCNVLPALNRTRPAVYYLPWGIAPLDRLAERQWELVGVKPVALTTFAPLAHGMMSLAAGLHCFVGPVP